MLPTWLRRARRSAYATARGVLSAGAAWTGAYRLASRAYGGAGFIFTLHRVVPPGQPLLWPGYAIHADVLDRVIATTRRMGWEPVSLDEMQRRLAANGAGGARPHRFACFTLDDGYRDNLEVALPVFRKHDAPFCVYVTTGLVERSAFYWWGALEDLVTANERVEWATGEGAARVFAARTWEQKQRAYHALGAACDRAGREATEALLRRYGIDWRATLDRDVLTRQQVVELAADPLATIGGHCVAHERLAPMSEADALRELADGRRILEGWIGAEVRHLAFPFGSPDACGPRESALARQAGYATAVTTRRGNVFPLHRDHLAGLPRREIPVDLVKLRNALSGVESALRRLPAVQTVDPVAPPPPRPGPRAHAPRPAGEGTAAATTRVVKNSIWLIAQPLFMNVLSLVATAYIARTLGRVDYGRFIFALSFIAMFAPLTNLGLRFVAIRHVATSGGADVSSFVGRISVLRFLLALASAGLAVTAVTLAHGAPETRQVVYLASCIIALQAVSTTATDVFQAYENMRLVAQVQFVAGFLLTALSVIALYLGLGLNGLMASYVVGNLCGAALAVYYLYTRFVSPRLAVDLAFWKASLAAAAPLFLPTFVREAGSRLGIVMLGGLVHQGAVGTYGAASTLVERIAVIPDGVCSALFPTLAGTYERSQADAAALYRRFARYFLIVGLPIAVGATVLAKPIIELIYGSRFEQSPLVLAVLAWVLFANFFVQLQGWSVAAIKQEKKAFFVPILATAAYLPLCLVVVPRFEELGLAGAAIVMAAVHGVLYRRIVREHLTARSVKPGLVVRVVAANAVMAAAALAVRDLPVFVSIPVGAAVYAAALLALRAVPLSEAAQIVGAVRGRLGLGGRRAPAADPSPAAAHSRKRSSE